MIDNIGSDFLDAFVGFKNVAGRSPLLFQFKNLFVGLLFYEIVELLSFGCRHLPQSIHVLLFTKLGLDVSSCERVHFLVELGFTLNCGVRCFSFVENLHRCSVINGILQFVLVDVRAKSIYCLLLVLDDDQRRSSEGQTSGVREGFEQIVTEVAGLRSVRLIDHQQDSF